MPNFVRFILLQDYWTTENINDCGNNIWVDCLSPESDLAFYYN